MIRFSATVTAQYPTPFSPFPPEHFAQSLGWLAQSGFDAAEVCISSYDEGPSPQAIKQMLDRHRLGCSTISTGQALKREDISLTHPLAENRARACARLVQHIGAARLLGCCVTVGLLRGRGQEGDAAAQLALLGEALRPAIAEARRCGVPLLLEPLNRRETRLLNTTGEVVRFIRELGAADCMGLLLDTFHAHVEGEELLEAIDRLGPAIRHVHLADADRSFPGQGPLDFGAIYRQLLQGGFSGYISLECFNLPSSEYVVEQGGRFVAGLRERYGG